ncbi:MAG TPA: radical SAM protein [Clostridiaceae bacterium]|nr:radical SAM protein [Clostridiaceae bacterium]
MEYILLGAPMHVNWNYTYKCNFNCTHCYSRTRMDLNELDFEDKMIVAKNIAKNKVFNVNLGGGEPLLCNDCFEVIRFLSEHNIQVNLSTNGWKLTKEVVSQLQRSGLRGVSVSIDNSDSKLHDENRNQPNSWAEACRSIRLYVEAGFHVSISTTITTQNYGNLEEIIKLGVSLGVNGIDFKRLKTMGNAYFRQDLELSESQKEQLYSNIVTWKKLYPITINLSYGSEYIEGIDNGCPCGKTSLAIMCNGDISPCVYNTYKIGNAVKDDIHDVWCNSESLIYLRSHYSCMGFAKKGRNMYKLNKGIVFQKDYRIDEKVSIAEYFKNANPASELFLEDTIAVVAIKGTPYGLNKTGAIILEEIASGKSIQEISSIIATLFKLSDERANSEVLTFCDELVRLGVLTRA